jgi:hypothetical protein
MLLNIATVDPQIFPNDLIALFWDDLIFGGGKMMGVFYHTGTDLKEDYFVVEWHRPPNVMAPICLYFEAVLYDTGDIRFNTKPRQYSAQRAVGSKTDGVDGLQYSYNALDIGSDAVSSVDRQFHPRLRCCPAIKEALPTTRWAFFNLP